ncbi:MAG: phytanoyl-CoA dioxygenase family protein [Gammaproteobacteria bacterium]
MNRALDSAGFVITDPILSDEECSVVTEHLSRGGPIGARNLLQLDWCVTLARRIVRDPAVAAAVSQSAVPVQCTAFEKSPQRNWLVSLHQDLSIPVAEQVSHPELTGWSQKEGVLYAQPPAAVLEQLVAVRVHLDPCRPDDGSLRVVAGSHSRGRITDVEALALRDRAGEIECAVARGAVLIMRPLLLHASSKLKGNHVRRVLHFLFGPRELPFGLRWANAL